MTAPSASPSGEDAQQLLASVTGVVSAHVVTDSDGRFTEIHILARPTIHPKRVVRNVESALGAGLGIRVDRRIISVAQVEDDTEAIRTAEATTDETRHLEPSAPPPARYEFVRYSSRREVDLETTCEVTLRYDDNEYNGTGKGADTPQGRATAAARAVLDALAHARNDDELALEAAVIVESHGQPFILVAAHAHDGRHGTPLAGAASLARSPEEAAILAALQATNRWNDPRAQTPD